MLLRISGREQVGLRRRRAELQPFASRFHQLAERLIGGITASVLVGGDDRLGGACAPGQFSLGEPVSASDSFDEAGRIDGASISDRLWQGDDPGSMSSDSRDRPNAEHQRTRDRNMPVQTMRSKKRGTGSRARVAR